MTDDIIDLSEDISELWDFLPLSAKDVYPEYILRNCFIRNNTDFYNNASLNICHFYNYILHTYLCRLYLADENNIELLKYIQLTKEVFSRKDGSRRDLTICCENINLNLFTEIEKEAINYFYHILHFDKSHQISKKHQHIIDIRNSVAHLNYTVINRDVFLSLRSDIVEVLSFIANKIYQNTRKIIYEELDDRVRRGLLDKDNYQIYFDEISQKHYFSGHDYQLMKDKGLLKDIKENSYKYFIKLYIGNFLGIEIE